MADSELEMGWCKLLAREVTLPLPCVVAGALVS